MAIDDLRRAIRQTLLEGLPANSNTPSRFCGLRVADQSTIDRLLAELSAAKVRGRTWERPGRAILHAAPYQRHALRQKA